MSKPEQPDSLPAKARIANGCLPIEFNRILLNVWKPMYVQIVFFFFFCFFLENKELNSIIVTDMIAMTLCHVAPSGLCWAHPIYCFCGSLCSPVKPFHYCNLIDMPAPAYNSIIENEHTLRSTKSYAQQRRLRQAVKRSVWLIKKLEVLFFPDGPNECFSSIDERLANGHFVVSLENSRP